MAGMFDDLIPSGQGQQGGLPLNFDDLIPQQYDQTLQGARQQVMTNPGMAAMGGVLNAAQGIPYIGTFTDETGSAIGAIPSLVTGGFKGYGEDYDKRQMNQQALRQASSEIAGPGGTLVPQLITGTGFGMAMPGPKMVPTSMMGAIGQGAGQGAMMGAAYGAGEGDASKSTEDSAAGRLGSALMGSASGGAVGGVVGGVGRQIAKALHPEAKSAPEIKAAYQAMADDQTPPADLAQTLQDRASRMSGGWSRPGMPSTIGDIAGPNAQALAENVANKPGAGMAEAARVLEERNTTAPVRGAGIIEEHIAPLDYLQKMQQAQQDMGSNAVKQGYQQAYDAAPKLNSPEVNQAVDRLTSDPLGQRVWKNAQLMASRDGQSFGSTDAAGNLSRNLGTREIDYLKKSADDLIGARMGTDGNMTNSELRFLTSVKNQMVKATDTANPAYATARKNFGDPASVKTAMEEGRDLLSSKDWFDTWQEYKNAPDIEKNGLLSGVASKVSEMLKAQGGENPLAKAGNDARKFVMNPEVRTRLDSILGSDKAQSMIEALSQEAGGQDFANRILSNSATARRLMTEETLNKQAQTGMEKIGPVARYAANWQLDKPASWLGVNPQTLEKAAQNANDASRGRLNEGLAKLLLNTNTADNLDALHKIGAFGALSQQQKQALAAALANQSKFQGPAAQAGRMLIYQGDS